MRGLIHSWGRPASPSIFLLLIVFISVSACGGGGAPPNPRASADFDLRILPDSFLQGGSGEFELKVDEQGDTVRVELLAADARALKAVYFELGYDPARYTPLGVQSSGMLSAGEPAARQRPALLELGLIGEPGTVYHGQLLARPQEQRGFTGRGVVATVTFARRPMPRAVSAAPRTNFSKTTLSWSAVGVLSWRFASAGDYNQDGEVGINDMTPLGAHFNETVAPAKFPEDQATSVIDGDSNGAINIQDITPIGANFKVKLQKYLVYSSVSNGDYPAANGDASSVPALGEVQVADSPDSVAQNRRSYSFTPAAPEEGAFYWVRPADDDGPGTPSNAIQYFAPNQGPVADITADVSSGPLPLTVNFDASGSSDPDGAITRFRIDYDGEGTFHDWVDMGTETQYQHTFDLEGEGVFNVRLEVMDDRSAVSYAQIPITVSENVPPTASFTADPESGPAQLEVTFDGSASSDDVGIAKYEWDTDGDGVFELDSGATPSVVHIYASEGMYPAGLRVTDTGGLTHVAPVVMITVGPAAGAPVADIVGDQTSGPEGMTVNFSGAGSTDDGAIMRYEWDWEGDGIYDEESTPLDTASHQYNIAGMYAATLRVTDNEDNTDTAEWNVEVFSTGPVAVLYANPRYGPVGQKVDFDASASTSNATITDYDWDWEGDGVFDYFGGADPFVTQPFDKEGVYDTTLRITDELDQQAEKIMLVFITADENFIPDDSVFILPSQSKAQVGETVGIEIYCKSTANSMRAPIFRVTLEEGNESVPNSYNTGKFGGGQQEKDGVWEGSDAGGFLSAFFGFYDAGGGRVYFDTIVAPTGDFTDLINATGAMMNMELIINVDTSFGFIREDGGSNTTLYQESGGQEHTWSNDDNAGLPGIDVL